MNLEEYRLVLLDAILKEVEARVFYEDVAELIKDNQLKDLFMDFAREEAKHERILMGVLKKEQTDTTYFSFEKDFKVAESLPLPDVSPEMNLKDAIALAVKNEEAAMNNYLALAAHCEDAALKAVFEDLAAMEREHKYVMEERFVNVAFPEVW